MTRHEQPADAARQSARLVAIGVANRVMPKLREQPGCSGLDASDCLFWADRFRAPGVSHRQLRVIIKYPVRSGGDKAAATFSTLAVTVSIRNNPFYTPEVVLSGAQLVMVALLAPR